MDQSPLSKSYHAVQPLPTFTEAIPAKPARKFEQATATPSVPSRTYSRTSSRKSKQPSCNLCRRRKIKCDRANPCSHCVRVDAVCVSSAPSGAPRGRQGGRRKLDSELLDRIAKLESLVNHFEGGVSTGATPPAPAPADGNHVVRQQLVSSLSSWI
jgi:Fungal Zn(2)-Cys(6) binuclear cluster domain